MKKHFLGIVCFTYTILILYVKFVNNLRNYLAPQMQKYILWSVPVLILIGLVMCFNNHVNYEFRVSDLILFLPVLMLILSGDGNLSMSLVNNRNNNLNNITKKTEEKNELLELKEIDINNINKEEIVNENNTEQDTEISYNFTNVDYDVVDAGYSMLSGIFSYPNGYDTNKFIDKTIKVRGFAVKSSIPNLPNGYFAIGKYVISCCAADATFGGFLAQYDLSKIKENSWYEIEGVLKLLSDNDGNKMIGIKVINIKEIDGNKEEQYVYPCYSYDDGSCSIIEKYNLNN